MNADVKHLEGKENHSGKRTGRTFITVQDVQYYGGCSVLWRIFITVKDIQYCEGYSVL